MCRAPERSDAGCTAAAGAARRERESRPACGPSEAKGDRADLGYTPMHPRRSLFIMKTMAAPTFPRLTERVAVLGANFVLAYGIFYFAADRALPTGGLESVWFLSALALWFLTLLSAPWFLPPRDGLVNAVAAISILVTIDLAVAPNFRSDLNVLRWVSVGYAGFVVAVALTALFRHDSDPKAPSTKLSYRLNGIFGRGEILYTFPALISILGAYQSSLPTIGWLLVFWIVLVVACPVERVAAALRQWRGERAATPSNVSLGQIARIDHPNILRVKLTTGSEWKAGTLNVAAMPDGDQQYVLALFTQVQGIDVIGTGLCLATLQEPLPIAIGSVCLSHDQDKAAEFLENLSGSKGSELVGFTVEGSTIGALRFEVALSRSLQEGEVVFARMDGQDVFYQILDAETAEESFDQNPRGTHIVRAAQLGCYAAATGFTKFAWLPTMNTPLFSAKAREFPPPTLSDREFIVGRLPTADVGVAANVDDIIEYHTAILGVTGTGKTELALDLVREAVSRKVKVFCVDFTGDYRQRLGDLKPEAPAPSKEQCDELEKRLFAVETGKFGAPDEKKALREEVEKLRESVSKQISTFLETEDNNLAIFELTEITNSKATLRITELYLSTIMSWAKENRKSRQIMVVLEEAHTIVPESYLSGFDYDTQWVVNRIGQIALQGRKYGVGLVVVTQRTALVSKTILSQCNTYFTHSLIDQTSLSFLDGVYSSQHTRLIPNLANLQFLAFGKALRAERPILLCREFDPAKKAASDALRKPLKPILEQPGAGPEEPQTK